MSTPIRGTRLPEATERRLGPGTPVAVYNPSLSSWTSGFEVASRNESRYRLRRVSDRAVLPREFTPEDLRRERHTDAAVEGGR